MPPFALFIYMNHEEEDKNEKEQQDAAGGGDKSVENDTQDFILETARAARNVELADSSSIEFPPMQMSSN